MKPTAIIPYLLLASASAYAEKTLFDFSELSQQQATDSRWQYMSKNEPCFDWVSEQGKWCRNDGWRFFWYYTAYQTEHMGFTRFGHMLPDSPYSSNLSDLLLVGTGGAYRDEANEVQMAGAPIIDAEGLQDALQNPSPDRFSQPVPGSIALYYKHVDPLRRIPEFQEKTNRLRMTVWMPEDADAQTRYRRSERLVSTAKQQIALYPFINSGKAGHYYHHAMNRGFGQWVTLQFDSHPTHHNQPTQPPLGAYTEGGFDYPRDGAAYFAAMTSFSLVFYNARNKNNPYMMMMGPWKADFTPFENEETINNLSVGFDPKKKQFDISFEDKYRCKDCSGTYEVRYSPRPITNENWNSASRVSRVENFFIEDDNEAQRLMKPSPYYTQVWGKVSINSTDFKNYAVNGRSIYFAVRDLSERNFGYDPDDDSFVPASESGLRIPKRHLVKTIRYDFRESPTLPQVENKNLSLFKGDYRTLKQNSSQTTSRGVFTPKNTLGLRYSALADGYAIEAGSVRESGKGYLFGMNDSSWLSYWAGVDAQVVERDCLTGVYCIYTRLAELTSTGAIFSSGRLGSVSTDLFSGFREAGLGLISGSSGLTQFMAFTGDVFKLSPVDVVELSITNTTTAPITTPIHYSTTYWGSRNTVNALAWNSLSPKTIPAKTTINFYIKAADIGDSMSLLNINIPYDGVGLSLSSLSLYAQP